MTQAKVLSLLLLTLTGVRSDSRVLDPLIEGEDCDVFALNLDSVVLSFINRPIITTLVSAKESRCIVAICTNMAELKQLPELAKMKVVILTTNVTEEVRHLANKRMGLVTVLWQNDKGKI